MSKIETTMTEQERAYTWEEASWVTGLAIDQLLELYRRNPVLAPGLTDPAPPPHLSSDALDLLARVATCDVAAIT